jgi:2-amino-4-hydroxy-6-hydroxymethyldihydropteridine diphosphokinase
MNNVYLGLGSNISNRENFIISALKEVDRRENCRVIQVSSFYETKPYGKVNQENFINIACQISTPDDPHELFYLLKMIEKEIGRIPRERWGPREIDIDILLFEDACIETVNLVIPHPDMLNRGFVLMPLVEINPKIIHPKTKKLLKEYLDTNKENDILRISKNDFMKDKGS